ncbi:uncharacterized protein A4U43_C04F11760 [Asparagus officinalis]|uniref:Uncharacterized protein n=1 Tax=Asparagus officinalis TaxID=4686 RepID=A0A5P1F4L6_ASPOF|nr:uncharacterized protein A4U43_C04F11760 [Asparagus officinalis]
MKAKPPRRLWGLENMCMDPPGPCSSRWSCEELGHDGAGRDALAERVDVVATASITSVLLGFHAKASNMRTVIQVTTVVGTATERATPIKRRPKTSP